MSDYGVDAEAIRAAAFGVTIPDGSTIDEQIERLISKAELLLPRVCIDRRIADGSLSVDLVASIVEDMVVRITKNAKGIRQASIDDYSVTIDTALSSGALYLADAERAQLCPPALRSHRIGSIAIGIPAYRLPGGGFCA